MEAEEQSKQPAKGERKKEAKGSNTFDVVDNLRKARAVVAEKLATIPDASLVARCEALLLGLDDLISATREIAPSVEQLKGMTKGLQVAAPMVMQHMNLLKEKYPDPEQRDLLRLSRDAVVGCHASVEGGWRAQREEMVKTMGRFDGAVNSSIAILRKIEGYVDNYLRLLKEEGELYADPFTADESKPQSKPSKKHARKKAVRKVKGKQEAEQPN